MSLLEQPEVRDMSISMSDAMPYVKEAFGPFLERRMEPPLLEYFTACVLPGYESRMVDFYPGGKKECENVREDYICIHPAGRNERIFDVAYKNRVKLPKCRRCLFRKECPGLYQAYLEIFGDGEITPILTRPAPYYRGLNISRFSPSWGKQ